MLKLNQFADCVQIANRSLGRARLTEAVRASASSKEQKVVSSLNQSTSWQDAVELASKSVLFSPLTGKTIVNIAKRFEMQHSWMCGELILSLAEEEPNLRDVDPSAFCRAVVKYVPVVQVVHPSEVVRFSTLIDVHAWSLAELEVCHA